jgi:hypothetical protein
MSALQVDAPYNGGHDDDRRKDPQGDGAGSGVQPRLDRGEFLGTVEAQPRGSARPDEVNHCRTPGNSVLPVELEGVGCDPLKDQVLRQKVLRQSRSTIDGCWFWEGPLTSDGRYGRLNVPRLGEQMAHRVAYRIFVGEIPEGLTLDHLCGVTRCVNPAHLEPVTMRENVLRGNAPSAQNARKTCCLRGHEFTQDNTYRFPDGRRGCRRCRKEARHAYYLKRGV